MTFYEAGPAGAGLAPLFAAFSKTPGLAATSEYTYGELLGRRGAFTNWAQQKTFYKTLLFQRPTITLVPVGRAILEASGDLRLDARQNTRSLRLADAIHVATALSCGCVSFLTADKRLGNALPGKLRHFAPTDMDVASLLATLDA